MIVEDNLMSIFNSMFKNTKDWEYVTDIQKEKWFFIFNRYFSKMYPEKAQMFNKKSIDKVSAMNIWYYYMKGKGYPKWFWSKSEKKGKSEFTEEEILSLVRLFEVKHEDIYYLIENNYEFIKDELNYLNKLSKL